MTELVLNTYRTTLVNDIDDSQITLEVADVTALSAYLSGDLFRIRIDDELMLVSDVDLTGPYIFTIARGWEQSLTGAAHSAGADVVAVLTAGGLQQLVNDTANTIAAVAAGGTTGQVYTKLSGTDNDADWETPSGGGGGGGGAAGGLVNRIRFPNGGTATYTADTSYSGSYLPGNAADGLRHSATAAWAVSGNAAGHWWQVDWSVAQIIGLINIYPFTDSFGTSGTITFSDGSSVSYGATGSGADGRAPFPIEFAERAVTWMRVTSDGGGGTNLGIVEIEAYAGAGGGGGGGGPIGFDLPPLSPDALNEEMDGALDGAWSFAASSGTPTEGSVGNWMVDSPTDPMWNINGDVPGSLVLQPKQANTLLIKRAFTGPTTPWVIVAKVAMAGYSDGDDRITLGISTGDPGSSDGPTNCFNCQFHVGDGYGRVRSYGINAGGGVFGTPVSGVSHESMVYLAIAKLANGHLQAWASSDGRGWNLFNDTSGEGIHSSVGYVYVAVNDLGSTWAPVVATIDFIRFQQGSADMFALGGDSVGGVSGIPAGGTTGQTLTKASDTNYDADWETPSAVPSALDDLTDVDAAAPTDGQALAWDAGATAWTPQTIAGGGGLPFAIAVEATTLASDITDTDTTIPLTDTLTSPPASDWTLQIEDELIHYETSSEDPSVLFRANFDGGSGTQGCPGTLDAGSAHTGDFGMASTSIDNSGTFTTGSGLTIHLSVWWKAATGTTGEIQIEGLIYHAVTGDGTWQHYVASAAETSGTRHLRIGGGSFHYDEVEIWAGAATDPPPVVPAITRGVAGTTAAAHAAGVPATYVLTGPELRTLMP